MNKQIYDIVNELEENREYNQRELAELTGYAVGSVNASLKQAKEEGYIDENKCLTDKAKKELEAKKPKNAVILAAGYGMRMVPINVEVPKGLLEVKGEPLIERMICQLHQAGIREIYVVVGFMKEQYEYLIDKYGVELVFNKDYAAKNNLHSLNCVADRLGNTYVVPCDIWCKENPFSGHEWYSWYMVTEQKDERSSVRVNRKKELVSVKGEEEGNCMIGIAYLLQNEAKRLKEALKVMAGQKEYDHAFWEQALWDGKRMMTEPREVKSEMVCEINTYEELRELDSDSNQLQSDVIQLILQVLACKEKEITEIRALKKGMTNRSFQFSCRGKKYIMRIPGEGTDKMINRKQEYDVYTQLAGRDITDPVVYMSPESGYKITEYMDGVRNCNSEEPEDVKRCMQYLKKFHELNLKVDHAFDLYDQIEYYESLWEGETSAYRDYQDTKKRVYELRQYIDAQPKQVALTHIDAVCDNFLIRGDETYLIDWEYAGMQDVHVDIAMFAIYAMYDREQIDQLIDFYFDGATDRSVRIKIYCYIATCGLLWSNWCEYKRICGVEFGEYSLKQYRYAKEYYRIVKKELEKDAKRYE